MITSAALLPGDLLERMEDIVGTFAILKAEMATLTRQHAACEFLLSAAEERIQGNFATDDEHAKLYAQLQQLATTVDFETRKIWEAYGGAKPNCADSDISTCDSGASLPSLLQSSPEVSPSGSAAVNFARSEHHRATMLEDQVTALLAERDNLQEQLANALSHGTAMHQRCMLTTYRATIYMAHM